MENRSLDLKGYFEKLNIHRASVPCCSLCETSRRTFDMDELYCEVCGTKSLIEGRVSNMLYKAIKTTAQGKALVCPHCDNEELNGGDFCMVCGSEVVNHCMDMCDVSDGRVVSRACQNILPGNARYCPRCGNEGAFFQKGWLLDWRSENLSKALKNINSPTVSPAPVVDIGNIRASGS